MDHISGFVVGVWFFASLRTFSVCFFLLLLVDRCYLLLLLLLLGEPAKSMSTEENNTKKRRAVKEPQSEPVGSIEEHLADMTRQNVALEANNATLEARKVALEASNVALEAKNVVLEARIFKYSMRRLASSDVNVPFVLKEEGSGDSNTGRKKKHPNGSAGVERDFVFSPIPVSKDAGPNEIWEKPSTLLTQFIDEKTKKYSSEADISSLVNYALADAKKIVTALTGVKLDIRHEYSIFSNRPDHFVVFDNRTGAPVVAVEDKKPWKDGNKAQHGCGPAVGQVFDYLSAMKCFGHAFPFVVLTTFAESTLFWFDDNESKAIAMNQSNRRSVGTIKDHFARHLSLTTETKTPSPPEAKPWEVTPPDQEEPMTEGPTFHVNEKKRSLKCSEEFGSKDLVCLFYNAIMCGLASGSHSSKQDIHILKTGENIDCGALKMTADSYEWGRLHAVVGDPIPGSSRPRRAARKQKKAYYVIAVIGQGSTSKVFHAVDDDGQEVVIKMYTDRMNDKDDSLLLDFEAFKEKSKTSTATEIANYEEIYPFLKGKVAYKFINGFSCVVMPMFTPLTKEEQKCDAVRKQIVSRLQDFQAKGKMYADHDFRWRHFGWYNLAIDERVIILFDLAELEEVAVSKETSLSTDLEDKVRDLLSID
jgi:hypothetical protein